MAEGFIIPSVNCGQSLNDVAESYFLNLLQRGFFQDVKRNMLGDIMSCKMHDLMHDLAQKKAEGKCMVATFNQIDFPNTTLHLSFAHPLPSSSETPNDMLNLKLLRTLLFHYADPSLGKSTRQQVVTKFRHLRVLDLHSLTSKSLPSSIDILIQLRYLDLSYSSIQILPDSITNLYNLQTLKLDTCVELKTLPTNIKKLVNLRCLDVSECLSLTHMPSGIEGLTLLYKLPKFVVGHEQYEEQMKKPTCTAKLSDLKKLINLKGNLSILIYGSCRSNISEALEADITHKHGLVKLRVSFYSGMAPEIDKKNHDEAVLEGLEPHSNIRSLFVDNYEGEKLPRWAMMDNLCRTLPNLVEIILWYCGNCQQVPSLSQLRFLKSLDLGEMKSVVYMESKDRYLSLSSKSQGSENIFFPSLEKLKLYKMENLKGWWEEGIEASTSNDTAKGKGVSRQQYDRHLLSLQFLKLSKLNIKECPNLIYLPMCPKMEDLTLMKTNKKLSVVKMAPISLETTSNSSFPSRGSNLELKKLLIDDAEDVISLSQLGLGRLSRLELRDKNLESTERLGEVFVTLSSSLKSLIFEECYSLRCMSKGLEHLTALEELRFSYCLELEVSSLKGAENESEEVKMMPWIAFKTSLVSLEFVKLPKVVSLPGGIQHMTNLRSLHITDMEELRELPEWITCLSSLNYLNITGCNGLTERCRSPDGADWPKIKHVPNINFYVWK